VREALFASSRARLDAQLAGARTSLAVWSFLLLAGAVAVALSLHVVRSRIIRPIESIGGTMLRLADNDLDAPLPKTGRTDEIGDMTEALRVFKANAIRRHRLQHDKHLLHERLKDAYRQLRRDLDAAAVMQTAMLPPPGRVSQVAYDALFRPSSVIAGDTYGVVPMEGRIAFFQVDVAGHGAPAALVSVASHHTLSQALLRHGGGDGLHEVVARINREWAEELPYFTMVLGEIDVEAERGALVQAGHPPPLLIAREGDVTTLGDGGFPVGLMSQAIFEATRFRFRPGDRLMVYSDGLVEAENESGEPFSDERLQALVRAEAGLATGPLLRRLDAELRRWRGSETLSDDMSVLVLERLRGEAG
jgi:serine phosphatase RsbU (regulator of sigma subunit)